MPKNYVEELAKWVEKHEASRQKKHKHLVTFLALRADVKAAIGAGYALKTIWEHLHETEKIPYRYETFLKHIRRYITQETANENQVKMSNPEQITRALEQNDSLKSFTFNPIPKKEDLF